MVVNEVRVATVEAIKKLELLKIKMLNKIAGNYPDSVFTKLKKDLLVAMRVASTDAEAAEKHVRELFKEQLIILKQHQTEHLMMKKFFKYDTANEAKRRMLREKHISFDEKKKERL